MRGSFTRRGVKALCSSNSHSPKGLQAFQKMGGMGQQAALKWLPQAGFTALFSFIICPLQAFWGNHFYNPARVVTGNPSQHSTALALDGPRFSSWKGSRIPQCHGLVYEPCVNPTHPGRIEKLLCPPHATVSLASGPPSGPRPGGTGSPSHPL